MNPLILIAILTFLLPALTLLGGGGSLWDSIVGGVFGASFFAILYTTAILFSAFSQAAH